ncbi:low quality protein: putative nuclease harbi1 [Plakobranchus ocellatus]|uniref:Low quality protein: putative nuclease harbi1 n=1 Tax=Plakobranchus ocellatus TaxID=259542 RepID=A0AAV3YP39_9GAST|nr:low quality protein: putative nuclease harbi1 [Plakobranchus ocellatus]
MAAAARYARRALRRERIFEDRKNPLEIFDETELRRKYRFPSWTILQLTDVLEQSIAHHSRRSAAVPALLQVCLTLRYLASGSFQDAVGEHLGLHQTTGRPTYL